MKAFGFLSFGHYARDGRRGLSGRDALHQAIELSVAADDLGVNGAYFRVHHFAPQGASPMPLLSAIAARTKHIEVGTGVIDMRYENPLYLAEEAAALDQIADGRVALGVSRGSPEIAERGWESFGYRDEKDPRGGEMAREKFYRFLEAIEGRPVAHAAPEGQQYPLMVQPGSDLAVFPQSPGLRQRIWWGAGSNYSAELSARDGVNMMSSTLVFETDDRSFGEIQAEQIALYRAAWKEAGHAWTPRVSVSRSIFPLLSAKDRGMYGLEAYSSDQVGRLDMGTATFGRSYAAAPDVLIEQLQADPAIAAADTLLLTIPNQLGFEENLSIISNFAKYVAPELGWIPADQGPVTGYPIQ